MLLYLRASPTMSQKRKHSEVAEGGHGAPQSKKQRSFMPGAQGRGPHKKGPRRGKTASASDESRTESISALKSRIRNLSRLLGHVEKDEKSKMPVTVRNERERELEACRRELAEKQAADREAEFRNKIISKYHHIRFFGKPLDVGRAAAYSGLLTRHRATKSYA